jgi:N-acyl-D-amino-acid deacylase
VSDYDLIISNGILVDGARTPRYKGDVGVRGDRIAALGDLSAANAQQRIDAQGQCVAPGFVDVHNHSDGWLRKIANFTPKTLQGFTTEVIMAAPWPWAGGAQSPTTYKWVR